MKYENEDNSYIVVSEPWVFVLNKNNELKYNPKFDDFILYNNNYIWYIKSISEDKISDLWLKSGKNYLIEYNPISLEYKVILEPNINIDKIIKEKDNIYIIDDVKKYKLEINN